MSELSSACETWLKGLPEHVARLITFVPDEADVSIVVRTGQLHLSGWVTECALTIPVDFNDRTWDLLISLDVLAKAQTGGGFVCDLCEGSARVVFPTIEALWRDHLLDPFAAWIVEELLPAKVLAL